MTVEFTYSDKVIGIRQMDCIPRKGERVEVIHDEMRGKTGIAKPGVPLVLEVNFVWWVITPSGETMVTINLN